MVLRILNRCENNYNASRLLPLYECRAAKGRGKNFNLDHGNIFYAKPVSTFCGRIYVKKK